MVIIVIYSNNYHCVSLWWMVLDIIMSVYDEWSWLLLCQSMMNGPGYYYVSLWWLILIIIMSVYDEWSWLLSCQSTMNGPGYYHVSLQWTIQTVMFDVYVCRFCLIFVYELLLQVCRFLTRESVCIWEEFWNVYLLITKFDCPEVTLCGWRDVKIQLLTR